MSLYLGATPIANTGYDKANINLSNLTSTGQNIANWSSNITNCITEIPQDIKLELNNGTLTLKAGSKVYKLDGTPITVNSDVSLSTSIYGLNQQCLLFYSASPAIETPNIGICFSGSGYPTITTYQYMWYFDSSNKKYYWTSNSGSTWTDRTSGYGFYPIGIATIGASNWVSIDQVFNGFGYIGSTIFVLPNVKGLIPNGRNADGTLKSNIFTTTSVMKYSINSDWGTGKEQFFINASNLNLHRGVTSYFISDAKPTVTASANYWYSPLENILRSTSDTGATWSQIYGAEAIKISFSSGKIDSMSFKTAFHAVDYNDLNGKADVDMSNVNASGKSLISGLSMPSNRYDNLTFGASGTYYTAPANGWFLLYANATSSNVWAQLVNLSKSDFVVRYSNNASVDFGLILPVNKNDVMSLQYTSVTLSQSWSKFRFYYAEGEPNV